MFKFIPEAVSWLLVFYLGILMLDMFLGLKFTLIGLTVALFAYKEAGSIIENLGECGVTLPSIISEKLEVLNTEKRNENKKESVEIKDDIDKNKNDISNNEVKN